MAAGSIIIDLLLKTGAFETDTARAAKSLKKLQKDAEAIGKAIGVALSGAAVALFAIVKSSIDSADHLNDLSQKTGIAADTLGGFGFAAQQAGGDIESVAAGLGKLNKTIAEAAAGNKDAAEVFKVLGISVKDSSGNIKDAGAIYLEIADKFATFEDGPNKAALALRAFGKAGLDQIPILNQGGTALRQQIDYFKQYSGVTNDTVKRADEFNDTLTKLKLLSGAFGNALAHDLLPSLQALASLLLENKEKGDQFKGTASEIAEAFKSLAVLGAFTAESTLLIAKGLGAVLAAATELVQFNPKGAFNIGKAFIEDISAAEKRFKEFRAAVNAGAADIGAKAADSLSAAIAAAGGTSGVGKKKEAPGLSGGDTGKKTDPFDALIKSAREMAAVAKESLAADEELNEAQKASIKIIADIRAGTLKLTASQIKQLDATLGQASADIKALELKNRTKQADQEAASAREAFYQQQVQALKGFQDEAKAAKESADAFGLTSVEVERLAIAKIEAAAASKELLAIQTEERDGGEALGLQYREQAKALRETVSARKQLLDANIRLDTDPIAGLSQAVKDYLDVVSKAGKATYDVTRTAIEGLEDVLVTFDGKDIKAKAKALVTNLIQEFYRLAVIRPLIASILQTGSSSGGLAGLIGTIGSLVGGSYDSNYSNEGYKKYASGTPWVPQTGMAMLHQGERVLTRKENAEGWGSKGTMIEIHNYTGAPVREEDGGSRGNQKLKRLIIGEMVRDSRTGGPMRQATREAVGPRPRRG